MAKRFHDDEPIECEACGELIYAGESYQYIKKEGKIYRCCDNSECMGNLLIELYGDQFSEVYLETGQDKESTWGDMEYDRRKDEGEL